MISEHIAATCRISERVQVLVPFVHARLVMCKDIEASSSLLRAGQSKYGAPETAAIFRHMSAFKNI